MEVCKWDFTAWKYTNFAGRFSAGKLRVYGPFLTEQFLMCFIFFVKLNSVSMANTQNKLFDKFSSLAYEPVLDSDSAVHVSVTHNLGKNS